MARNLVGTNFFTKKTATLDISFVDTNGLAHLGKCLGAPPVTADLFAHGCLMIQTDTGAGNPSLYENTGTSAAPVWNLVGAVTAGEIALAEGNILVGDAAGKAAALVAKTNAQILVGDGTTVASVAVSGDATITNAGLLTVANGAISPVKQDATARTRTISALVTKSLPAPTGADQLANNGHVVTMPTDGTVVSARIVSDTATAGSDATNQYGFNLRNATTGSNLGSSFTLTNGSELAADTPRSLTIDQNQAFTAGDQLVLSVNILDDAAAGPTDLSAAMIRVEVTYRI